MVHISLKLKQTGPKSVGSTLNCCVCVCVCARARTRNCLREVVSTGIWIYLQGLTLNLFIA